MYNFEILKEYGDEAEVKAKGKVLTKGKDYVVEVCIEYQRSMKNAKICYRMETSSLLKQELRSRNVLAPSCS